MSRLMIVAGILLLISLVCPAAEFADMGFAPPSAEKSLSRSALPHDQAAAYVDKTTVLHTFRDFEGANDALKAAEPEGRLLQIGVGIDADLAGNELLGDGFQEGSSTVYLAAIQSADAEAVRLRMDLGSLDQDTEVWVLDPNEAVAFGPHTGGTECRERWLATIPGDTAILMARSAASAVPNVRLTGISHFYRSLAEVKALSCHINIACETDPVIQQISSGVGFVLVPGPTGSSYTGTATLINVPETPELEPYLLTANHLVASESEASNTDVIWDYRSTQCGTNDAPPFSQCPRSNGVELLATSDTLDITLIRLDSVPVGEYGRAYVGWDTRDPVIGESVIGIHHPANTHMRISYGRIQSIDQTTSVLDGGVTLTFINQTRVGWDDGVTEGGSSGSCLLFADGTYRIAGTLSNGPSQTCLDPGPALNYDYYASFRDFWNDIYPDLLNGSTSDHTYEDPVPDDGGDDDTPGGCAGGVLGSGTGGGTSGTILMISLTVGLLYSAERKKPVVLPAWSG